MADSTNLLLMSTTAEVHITFLVLFILYVQFRMPIAFRALQCGCIIQLKDPRIYLENGIKMDE